MTGRTHFFLIALLQAVALVVIVALFLIVLSRGRIFEGHLL
jgi:hypothetical protein